MNSKPVLAAVVLSELKLLNVACALLIKHVIKLFFIMPFSLTQSTDYSNLIAMSLINLNGNCSISKVMMAASSNTEQGQLNSKHTRTKNTRTTTY